MEITLLIGLIIIATAFVCEYADSTLGMGYGTTMTPILLLLGFEPLQFVPIVLISEMITGVMAGLCHHKEGNIDLKSSFNWKIIATFVIWGIVGSIVATTAAVTLPKLWIKTYIGCLVLFIGIFLYIVRNKTFSFSWAKIGFVGLLASFNKAISGGGYGPLVCPGQILSGVSTKSAVAITSVSESLTCLVAASIYLLVSNQINWVLLPWILTGTICSVPFSAKSVKLLPDAAFRILISILTISLGTFTLAKIWLVQ